MGTSFVRTSLGECSPICLATDHARRHGEHGGAELQFSSGLLKPPMNTDAHKCNWKCESIHAAFNFLGRYKELNRVSSLNSWRFYFTGHEFHEFHGNDCCGLESSLEITIFHSLSRPGY